jgi:putative membrane protein insertion efficiency factor
MTAAPVGMTATTPHAHDHAHDRVDVESQVQSAVPARRARGPRRAAISLVKAYQGVASGRVSPCRFYPSCSNYAVEAFEVHGFWRATALTARRLLRCRPFGPHGVDLVPLPVDGRRRERNP